MKPILVLLSTIFIFTACSVNDRQIPVVKISGYAEEEININSEILMMLQMPENAHPRINNLNVELTNDFTGVTKYILLPEVYINQLEQGNAVFKLSDIMQEDQIEDLGSGNYVAKLILYYETKKDDSNSSESNLLKVNLI